VDGADAGEEPARVGAEGDGVLDAFAAASSGHADKTFGELNGQHFPE
jgi:hypothetical protein